MKIFFHIFWDFFWPVLKGSHDDHAWSGDEHRFEKELDGQGPKLQTFLRP